MAYHMSEHEAINILVESGQFDDIYDYLVDLSTGEAQPEILGVGLCSTLESQFDEDISAAVMSFSPEWPKFSGSSDYPVPSPYTSSTAAYAYKYGPKDRYDKWGDNPYGDLRRELALFLAFKLYEINNR